MVFDKPKRNEIERIKADNKMNKNKCETKFCRGEYAINYLGKKLCDNCWDTISKPKEVIDGTANLN